MKPISRKLDNLGRITIPTSYREALGLVPGDKLEVYLEGNKIVYRKPTGAEDMKKQLHDLMDAVESTAPSNKRSLILRCLQSAEEFLEE